MLFTPHGRIWSLAPGLMVQNGGMGDVIYLFRDLFTIPEAAPLTSPRTSVPGPGTLVRSQDTNNSISIAANKTFYFDPTNGVTNDGYKTGSNWTPAAGLTFRARVTGAKAGVNMPFWGFRRSTSLTQVGAAFLGICNTAGLLNIGTVAAGTTTAVFAGALSPVNTNKGDYWVIYAATGAHYVWTYKGVAKLLWVDRSTPPSSVTAGVHANGAGRSANFGEFAIFSLGAPWNDDFGLAVSHLAGARSSGDEFTHSSGNGLLYFTCTTLPSAGNEHDFRFRIQNATNYWKVTIDSAGAIKLFEVVDGSATQRGTTYTGVTAGQRIGITMQDSELDVNVAQFRRVTYASAATFLTATNGKLQTVGAGGSISEIASYPRDLSGAALTALQVPAWDTLVGAGDSIMYGYLAAPGFGDAVSNWLKAYFQNSGIGGIVLQNTVQNTVEPYGQPLANNMRDNISTQILAYNPKYVLLGGGLNDLRFSDTAFTVANYQNDLGEIIDACIAAGIPASHIIVCSPSYVNPVNYADSPPYNAGSTEKHVLYVAAAAAVATAKSTLYADLYNAMLGQPDPNALLIDGIHVNDAGKAVLSNACITAIGGSLA